MKIKTDNQNVYIIPANDVEKIFGVQSTKNIMIMKDTKEFTFVSDEEIADSASWVEEDVDGRAFRKLKKNVIEAFGDELLEQYRSSSKIYDILSKKFINSSGISDVMKNALANEMNVVFYGKGGFGKSEMIGELFGCQELKNRVFIKSLSEATTEEDLFGGINIKKMTESGVIEYNCENSFANKEIVIFEELFDAPARVLAALKDTLTSKEIRNGNQRFPIKTKIIIGLTNKTMDELIEDDSIEALMQRFAISYKMEYAVDALNTTALVLNRYHDISEHKVAALVSSLNEFNNPTPRKLLETAKYIRNLNVRKNKLYVEHITNNEITPVINYLKHTEHPDLAKSLMRIVASKQQEIKDERLNDYDQLVDMKRNLAIIKDRFIGDTNLAVKMNLGKEIDILVDLISGKIV